MTQQAKAIKLADELDKTLDFQNRAWEASKELRRLYAMNAALIEALKQAEQLLEYGQSNEALAIISSAIDKEEQELT